MQDVISVENMRLSDKYTIDNITPSRELMLRAGRAVYENVSWYGKIAIVCGVGNNGGDGYVIAGLLNENGYDCEIILIKNKFSEDGEYYFKKCVDAKIPYKIYESEMDFQKYNIIVDCIFGTGFKGDVLGVEGEVIKKINASGAYTVSVDINSGLNGDTGLCNLCVESNLTVSIGTIKSGHILNKAKDKIARLINCDIGITPVGRPYHLLDGMDVRALIKERLNYSHKGTYGYVALIGGSKEYSGAIKLANLASSCVRSGAGVVRLCVPRCISHSVMPYILESTLYELSDNGGNIVFKKEEIDGALKGTRAVAIGMGMGQEGENAELLSYVLENYEGIVIIDADGLNTLAKMESSVLKCPKGRVVLTPHLKEFERLSKIPISEINKNPIKYAKEYARKNNVILLLKGTATIITDGERVYLTNTGCPGMAKGGSGDVLSGVLAGICASNACSLIENVAISAYINGYAGEIAQDELCSISMTASDTAKSIAQAISRLNN